MPAGVRPRSRVAAWAVSTASSEMLPPSPVRTTLPNDTGWTATGETVPPVAATTAAPWVSGAAPGAATDNAVPARASA